MPPRPYPTCLLLLISALSLCFEVTPAQAQSIGYQYLKGFSPLQDRIAYLLTVLESDTPARAALASKTALQKIGHRLTDVRSASLASCAETTVCRVDPLVLPQPEIDQIADILSALAKPTGPLNPLVRDHLRPSGNFQKYAQLDDAALVRAAWIETANAINRLYRIYGTEQSYKMPNDGPEYGQGTVEDSKSLLTALTAEIDDSESETFFSPWSRLAFDLLIVAQRDEAVRYEPLQQGPNAAAFARARTLDWSKAQYSAILVPGIGLSSGETGVSASGQLLLRMAVKRWHQGLAPFLIVSGGHVHPNRTPYSEAIEMKKVLIAQYGLPEEAIVVDPYARHTTTNLRNAARLLFRMGAPTEKTFIVTTSAAASSNISSAAFADRCTRELGYTPALIAKHLSQFDLVARPNVISLHIDPLDPLDP